MESEELKKDLKMCQVMHTGEPALCVFAQGVPASGGVYKTLPAGCPRGTSHVWEMENNESEQCLRAGLARGEGDLSPVP